MFEPDGNIPVDINYLRSLFQNHDYFLRTCHTKKKTQLRRTIELASSAEINTLLKIFYVEFHGVIPLQTKKVRAIFSKKLLNQWKRVFLDAKTFQEFMLSPIQTKKKFILMSQIVVSACLDPLFNNGPT